MKGCWKIIACLCLYSGMRAQHNSDYLQYMFNGFLLNPAYAGSRNAMDLTTLYRKQWMGIDAAPVTASFGGHTPLKNRKVNLGLILVNDIFGIFNHQKAIAAYAYRIPAGRGQLALGLQGGVDYYTANWSRVKTIQQSDPSFSPVAQSRLLPTAGTGLYYHSEFLYLGIAVPELFYNDISRYRTAVAHGGFVVPVGNQFMIKPALLVKYIEGSPLFTNVSGTLYWKEIAGLGFGYTNNTAAFAYLDLRLNDQLRFGYGYEYSLTRLGTFTTGSHEVMIRYLFRYKVESASTRYF